MKVLIIGSGGYVGRHLLARLKADQLDVHGVSSSNPGGIDRSTGLFPDSATIPPGTDTIIYLAQSPYSHQVPDRAAHVMAVNVVACLQTVEFARRARATRLIYLSSGNVYAPSFDPLPETAPLRRDNWYSLSKVHAEEALALYRKDMEITIVRPFGIYGPGQTNRLVPNLINSVLQGMDIYIQKNPYDANDLGGLKISLCYIEDAVTILRTLIINGGPSVLNLASSLPASIRDIANVLACLANREVTFAVSDQFRDTNLIADVSLLRRVFKPEFTTLEDGLGATFNYCVRSVNV